MSGDRWKSDLEAFFSENQLKEDAKEKKAIEKKESAQKDVEEAAQFYQRVAKPAFEKISVELRKHGRHVQVNVTDTSAHIRVEYGGRDELNLAVRSRGRLVYTIERVTQDGKSRTREGFIDRAFGDTFENVSQDKLIEHTLSLFKDNARRLR
ncbi:MAG: hypothetical protein CL607_16675 [Anaerolineaceae bacterium]|nr:hypothetical protein [Anaerolineaceae bacterium]